MKRGKRPTRAQKILISDQTSAGRKLNPANWVVTKETETALTIRHRVYGAIRTIPKKKATS